MNSALLTKALVAQVAEILRPSIEKIIALDPRRNVAYVIVPDPVITYATAKEYYAVEHTPPGIIQNPGTFLWEGAFGEQDRTEWANPYDKFAAAKTEISWRTGLPSHLVQRDYPHLYRHRDFKFGGSVVYKGIIVGTSGLAWQHDLAVSGMFATTLHAFCIGAFETEFARKPYFIGELDSKPANV